MPKTTQTDAHDSIEKCLRGARKSKGLSLEDAARDTRIRKIHLKQFEIKVPDELDVYQIGYLRLYSRYLGVDIQPYLDARKAKIRDQPAKETDKKRRTDNLANVMKRKLNIPRALIIAIALVVALMSLVVAQWRKLGTAELAPVSSIEQDVPIVQTNRTSVSQTDRYTHVLTNYSGKIKAVANIDTVFTLLYPDNNSTISKGTLKTGEELPLPDAKSVIIKTTIPDALDIQQENKTPDATAIKQ